MAEIKTLKQGETQVLPRTVAEAVNTDSGSNVQVELDALKSQIENVDVSEQLKNYLPLSGGTMMLDDPSEVFQIRFSNNEDDPNTIQIGQDGATFITASQNTKIEDTDQVSYSVFVLDDNSIIASLTEFNTDNTKHRSILTSFSNGGLSVTAATDGKAGSYSFGSDSFTFGLQNGDVSSQILVGLQNFFYSNGINAFSISPSEGISYIGAEPTLPYNLVTKSYVDDQIAAIPTPDVSAQIETHNTSTAAHANMHWLTADDEMLSSIDPDGSIDADTLEGHPASYFATKTDLENVNVDLSNYYTKEEVDAKITQIQQLIDEAAALVDQINGEVI